MTASTLAADYVPVHFPRRRTPAEYLALEEAAEERHEYDDGQILAMAGGTGNHSIIGASLQAALKVRLRGKPCVPFDSNIKVRIPSPFGNYVYPDILVACRPHEYEDENQTILLNPKLVIEVVSPSSVSRDYNRKLDLYMRVPTIEMYLLVEQTEPYVRTIIFHRGPDGKDGQIVTLGHHEGLESAIPIPCLGLTLPMAEIYEDIEFPAPQPPPTT